MKDNSYLKKLLGKTIQNVDSAVASISGIKKDKNEQESNKILIGIQLYLEDYILNIYNPAELSFANMKLEDLIGLKVVDTSESKEEAKLIFDNGSVFIINLRDEAYEGPEAMVLYGPNNFWVVWN